MNDRMTFREAKHAIIELLMEKEDSHLEDLYSAILADINREKNNADFED